MAEADAPPDNTTVNIRMRESFLADLDETWKEQGFNSRSEYIRYVLRDSLKHPDFNRADLKAMLAGEREIQEGNTHSSEDVKAEFGVGESGRGDEG